MLKTKRDLLVAGMIVAGAIGVGIAAQSPEPAQSAPAAQPNEVQVIRIDGYPLDRTLKGLTSYPKLDAVLLLTDIKLGEARWTTPDGEPPLYILQNRVPNLDEVRRNDVIVTPVTGTITQVLRGPQFTAGDDVTFEVAGGQVLNVKVQADEEIAPNLDRLIGGGQVLLAGEVRKATIIPSFVYSLETDGNGVKSLLKSASDTAPEFRLGDLKRALARKQ
jgi:hypothetical protein